MFTTNWPSKLKAFGKRVKQEYDSTELRYHQYVVVRYLFENPKQRGLLVYHGMGTGKTILAARCASMAHKSNSGDVILIANKTLKAQFQKAFSDVDLEVKFVSSQSSTLFEQVGQEELDKQLKAFGEPRYDLTNKILIFDEAHNFFNAICNGSKNAVRLYDKIIRTKKIKLLFLSGSPVVNTPFEFVPCFNMLNPQQPPLFSEFRDEFAEYFIEGNHIKNKALFMNRILGLVSYYGELYSTAKTKLDYPQQLELRVMPIEMSLPQFEAYLSAREKEKREPTWGTTSKGARFSEKGQTSTYRIKSRLVSNYMFPSKALLAKGGPSKGFEKHIELLEESDMSLSSLEVTSPKIKALLENVKTQPYPQLIYSEFVTNEGLGVIRLALLANGYTEWVHQEDADLVALDVPKLRSNFGTMKSNLTGKRPLKFALITGQVPIENRIAILNEVNREENLRGDRIALLLISRTGAEGLDCKCMRAVHLLEPFWNYARIEQVIARAVRYKSHIRLPMEERTVQPFIYLSVVPKEVLHSPRAQTVDFETQTTDEQLFHQALQNKKLINEFLEAMVEASCDCHAHHDDLEPSHKDTIKCLMCAPNDKPLFGQLSKDMRLPNPCQPPEEQEIIVNEIIVNQEKFYYDSSKDRTLYRYDIDMEAYVPLEKSHPLYGYIQRRLQDTI